MLLPYKNMELRAASASSQTRGIEKFFNSIAIARFFSKGSMWM
jgi:hypothetical protein